MRMPQLAHTAGWVILVVLTGCAFHLPQEAIKKEVSLQDLLHLYQNRLDGIKGFKGLANVTVASPRSGYQKFKAAFFSGHSQIRVEGFDLLGGTLFDFTITPSTASLTIPLKRKAIHLSRDAFEKLVQKEAPFGSIEFLDWIKRAGIPEITPYVPVLEKTDDFLVLSLVAFPQEKASLQKKVWIERSALWVKKVETFDPAGALRAVVTMDRYRRIGQQDIPFVVEWETQQERVAIQFTEVALIPQDGAL